MEQLDKQRHDVSSYERPNYPFRCGRAARWGKPCWQGPNLDGTCGGINECTPQKRGDHFECQRPLCAGGPCEEGPLPDGRCCHSSSPCRPRTSLRRMRKQTIFLACGFVLALIAAFTSFTERSIVASAAINPGTLSSVHSGATASRGCVACHSVHNKDTLEWFSAAFGSHDQTDQCLACHTFGGPGKLAHNRVFAGRNDLEAQQCSICHMEHKGSEFKLSHVSDTNCGSCHKRAFTDFSKGHVAFASNFPYSTPNAIRYDHLSHENKSTDPRLQLKFRDRTPSRCTTCHEFDKVTKGMKTANYATGCASCHDAGIRKQELVLFDQSSPGELTELLIKATEGGRILVGSSADMVREMDKTQFPTELIRRAVADLGSNKPYKFLPDAEPESGWWTDETSIRYIPKGHEDPLIRAWLNFTHDQYVRAGATQKKQTLAGLNIFLDFKHGPGACAKCHGVNWGALDSADAPLRWKHSIIAARPNTIFNHDPHIDRLDPNASCQQCHKLNKNANYASYFETHKPESYVSNYLSITKEICGTCHNSKLVSENCQTCHVYHVKAKPQSMVAELKN